NHQNPKADRQKQKHRPGVAPGRIRSALPGVPLSDKVKGTYGKRGKENEDYSRGADKLPEVSRKCQDHRPYRLEHNSIGGGSEARDRKSTRLNSSHVS